jgi:hypothetical protein
MRKVAPLYLTPYNRARREGATNTLKPLTNPPLKRSDDVANSQNTLTQERLKELLHYDPETGVFTWLQTRGQQTRGCKAGSPDKDGYIKIGINRRSYRAHRLAWFYVNGSWPTELIDHINGEKADNRIANLRKADFSENCQNLKGASKRSTTGLLGVRAQKKKGGISYQAAIRVRGEFIYLGTHPTPEAAHTAYMEAKERLHRI